MSNVFLRALRRKGGRRGLKRKSRRQRKAASSRGSSCGGGFVAGGFRPIRDEVLVERLRNYREWLESQKGGKAVWESIFETLMLEVQRQLLSGTVDRTFRKWLQSFMSMKAWNKLMHALNGNIFSYLVSIGVTLLRGLIVRPFRQQVKISDSEILDIALQVLPSSEFVLASLDRYVPDDFDDLSVYKTLEYDIPEELKEYLVPCHVCEMNGGFGFEFKVPTNVRHTSILNCRRRRVFISEIFVYCLQYICNHVVDTGRHLVGSLWVGTNDGFPLPSLAMQEYLMWAPISQYVSGCECGCINHAPLSFVLDSAPFYSEIKLNSYKVDQVNYGIRCPFKFPGGVHQWNPRFVKRVRSVKDALPFDEAYCIAKHLVNVRLMLVQRGILDGWVGITSWTSRLGRVSDILRVCPVTIVIVHNRSDYLSVQSVDGLIPAIFPILHHPRSGADIRVLVQNCLSPGYHGLCHDARLTATGTGKTLLTLFEEYPIIGVSLYPEVNPVDHCKVTGGQGKIWCYWSMAQYRHIAGMWGADEILMDVVKEYISYFPPTAFNFALFCTFNSRKVRTTPLRCLMSRNDGSLFGVLCDRLDRFSVLACMRRYLVAPFEAQLSVPQVSMLWLNWGGMKGTFLQRDPCNYSAIEYVAPNNQSVQAAFHMRFGPIILAPFGSHGDIIPLVAIGRQLSELGFDVIMIPGNTQEEGLEILSFVEKGNVVMASPFYLRHVTGLSGLAGFVIAPTEFVAASHYTLQPPPGFIRSVSFGAGMFVDMAYHAMLSPNSATPRICAYPGILHLPRSADGVKFLPDTVPNTVRDIDILVAWGSSSLNRPVITGAIDIVPGDHVSQFSRAKVTVSVGGAGTVQTAASCGSRVIVGSSILDRNYYDPLDAGQGVIAGQNPSKVLLLLNSVVPQLVIPFIWAHPLDGMIVLCATIWMHFDMLAWVSFVLFVIFSNTPIRWVLGTGLVNTLIATSLRPFFNKWVSMFLSYFGWQVIKLISSASSVPGLDLTFAVLHAIGQGLTSPFFGIWLSLWSPPVAIIASMLFSTVVSFLATVGRTLIGIVDFREPTYRHAILEIFFIFAGNFPVLHTRLVSSDYLERYEGDFIGPSGTGGWYQVEKLPYEPRVGWHFAVHTKFPWESVPVVPKRARYSLYWNCQTSILLAVQGNLSSLGLGWFLIGGLMIVSLIIGSASILLIMVAILCVAFVSQLLWLFGSLELGNQVGVSARYLSFVWSLFNRPGSTLYTKLILGLAGVTQGWGDAETLQSSRIMMLQSLARRIRNDEQDWDLPFSQIELQLNARGFQLNDIEKLVIYADLWIYPEDEVLPEDFNSVIKFDRVEFPSDPNGKINTDVLFDVLLSQEGVSDDTRSFWMKAFGLSTSHHGDQTLVELDAFVTRYVKRVNDLEVYYNSVNNDSIVSQLVAIRNWLVHTPNDYDEMLEVLKSAVLVAESTNTIRSLLVDLARELSRRELVDSGIQCKLNEFLSDEVVSDRPVTHEGYSLLALLGASLISFSLGIIFMVPFLR